MSITETIPRAVESMPTGGVSLALGVELQQDGLYPLFEGLWGADLETVKSTVVARVIERWPKWDNSFTINSIQAISVAKRR